MPDRPPRNPPAPVPQGMTKRRRVPSAGPRGGAAVIAAVLAASASAVPAGALTTQVPPTGGVPGDAGSDLLALDPALDVDAVAGSPAVDPVTDLVATVGGAVDGLTSLGGDPPPPEGEEPAPTAPSGDPSGAPDPSPTSGDGTGATTAPPAERSGRAVVPADDGAADT